MYPLRSAFILAGLVAGLLCAAPVWADPPGGYDGDSHSMGMMSHGRPGMMSEMSAGQMKARLGLNDEQVGKLKALRRSYLKETLTLETKIKIAGIDLADQLDEKKLDLPAIEKKARELERLRGDLVVLRVQHLAKAGEFLTPEQFETFRSMTARRMQRGGMHDDDDYGPGPHGGGMPPGMGMGSGMKPGGHPPTAPGTPNPHQ